MTSKLKYHKDYTELGETYQLVLPLCLEGLVPEDESVRLLSHVLEELDYTKLYQAYSAKGRNPAVDPKTMFKILTYAYSQNIYSTRKIEKACRRDINFMWLLAGRKAPDRSTISRFRTGFLAEACEDLLKMFPKMEQLVALLNQEYMKRFSITKENRTQELQKIFDFIDEYCRENQIRFVYGRGKRKTIHQRYHELIRRFLDRQFLYDLHNSRFLDRNSYSKTDIDATFMHMKDDHMRNAQLKPGYNVQIGVDSEYMVSADIFQDRNDVWTLVPFLKTMEKNLGFRYPSVTADSGYLSVLFQKKQKSKSGYISNVTVYECEGCSGCVYKEKCTRSKGNKRLYVSKNFIDKRQESYENILSEKGILYRMNRSIQVEGAFGVVKNDYEFQRFLLRGKTKVKLEILLLCMGYNINKLHAKIQSDRTQSHFFDVKTA